MTLADDSQNVGRYECHAFAIGDISRQIRGFNVNVIKGKFSEMFLVTLSSFLAVTIQHRNTSSMYLLSLTRFLKIPNGYSFKLTLFQTISLLSYTSSLGSKSLSGYPRRNVPMLQLETLLSQIIDTQVTKYIKGYLWAQKGYSQVLFRSL